jgi:hypothetical protein
MTNRPSSSLARTPFGADRSGIFAFVRPRVRRRQRWHHRRTSCDRRPLSGRLAALFIASVVLVASAPWAAAQEVIKVGMIGLDTSHAPAFTKLINNPDNTGDLAKLKVVAAYPGGSEDIPSSRDRVEGFTEQLREMDVTIVDSIEELLPLVDAVLLESVDGRKHLEQVAPVFAAGKPVFIDKPLGGNLAQAIAIDLIAKQHDARWFSSSSLRFSPSIIRYREDPEFNEGIQGATAWSPCSLETSHTDLYWYGVHGVETLYTAMGEGCESVVRIQTEGTELVVGTWEDGRIGTFRGIRRGKSGYGLVVFGESEITMDAKYGGYKPLVERVAAFFLGGEAPVSNEETLEMFTFMEAADVSKERGGAPVSLEEVWFTGQSDASKLLEELDE